MRNKIESLLQKVESQASTELHSFIHVLRDDINGEKFFHTIMGLVAPQ